MKLFVLLAVILYSSAILAASNSRANQETREQREIQMGEQAILVSLAVHKNPKSQYLCTQNDYACLGPDQAELGLALISARNTKDSLLSLVRLLRFRTDASLSEDFTCYLLDKGPHIESQLRKLDPKILVEQCQRDVTSFALRNKSKFAGLDANAVCANADSIKNKVIDLLTAIQKKSRCDSGEF